MAERAIPIDNLPSNSNKSKEMAKTQSVQVRETKPIQAHAVTKGGAKDVLQDYVFNEVIVPNIKSSVDTIAGTLISSLCDSLTGVVKTFLFGEPGGGSTRWSRSTQYGGRRAYGSRYRTPWEPIRPIETRISPSGPERGLEDLAFGSRQEIEEVLARASDILDEYHRISVSTLYDIAGYSASFTMSDYGWYSLDRFKIHTARGEWILEIPPAIMLD